MPETRVALRELLVPMLLIWLTVFSTFVEFACHIAFLAESGRLCHPRTLG